MLEVADGICCSSTAAKSRHGIDMELQQYGCNIYFHFRTEFCLKQAISSVINPVPGNHRWEITDNVIDESMKHHVHFKQVSGSIMRRVTGGVLRYLSNSHSNRLNVVLWNRQKRIWDYIWGSHSKTFNTANTSMLVQNENERIMHFITRPLVVLYLVLPKLIHLIINTVKKMFSRLEVKS